MDLRFALFERIARDSVLSRLLVNYADRLDDRGVLPGPARDTCYLTMEWTTGDRTSTCSEGESLIVRAHVPRHRSEERSYLDVVLQRLDAAVAVDDADGSITVRRRVTSPDVVQTGQTASPASAFNTFRRSIETPIAIIKPCSIRFAEP